MKFSDEGIIISTKKYGESSLIVKIFSHHHGIYNGFVKSVKSSKSRTIFQIGNLISFEFHARVEENLGSFFAADLIKSYCSKILFESLKLNCVNSIFSMIDELFLERENQQILFEKLQLFLRKISTEKSSSIAFLADYVRLELKILKSLGYGIDLSSCAVTNSKADLVFVSPKSARAVSIHAGMPYKDKLLKLPNFLLREGEEFDEENLLNGLKLSRFFLQKFLFTDKKSSSYLYRANIEKCCISSSSKRDHKTY